MASSTAFPTAAADRQMGFLALCRGSDLGGSRRPESSWTVTKLASAPGDTDLRSLRSPTSRLSSPVVSSLASSSSFRKFCVEVLGRSVRTESDPLTAVLLVCERT